MGKERKIQRHCQFCKILSQSEIKGAESTVLYRDEELFAFHDIDKSSAREHVLVCTTSHIETALNIDSKDLLFRMRRVGESLLGELCKDEEKAKYRFGFHLPPYNSIDHVHLHCFLLPFSSFVKDQIVYGKLLTSVDKVAELLTEAKL